MTKHLAAKRIVFQSFVIGILGRELKEVLILLINVMQHRLCLIYKRFIFRYIDGKQF
jgi:hypothetical protein